MINREYKTTENRRAAQKRYRDKNREYYIIKSKEYNPGYMEQHKEKLSSYQFDYNVQSYKNERLRKKKLLSSCKSRAKINSIPFELESIDDLEWNTVCPLLGIEIKYGYEDRLSHCSPSIDRIDNTKGYIKGNVWIVSYRANTLKRNSNADELMTLATNLKLKEKELTY